MIFWEFFYLVPTFLLFLSYNFQLSLFSFCKLLPNLHKIIVIFQLVLKFFIISYILYQLYYILAKILVIDKTIIIAMPKFMANAINNKNKYLQYYTINLIDSLKLLQFLYFRKYNLILIIFIVRFSKQICTIDK